MELMTDADLGWSTANLRALSEPLGDDDVSPFDLVDEQLVLPFHVAEQLALFA